MEGHGAYLAGVLSVHVFGCQHLIMDGDSIPDSYQLYGKVSVGTLVKSTSVTTQAKKGKIIWNEVLNFPITIVSQMKDWSNQAVFSLLGYNDENQNKHRLIGKVAFHVHKLVKIGWSMDKYELTNRKKQNVGAVELEFAFSYGVFGYGFSDQLENLVHLPEEVLRQSMFPRVHPPEDNMFSKWCLLKPKTVAHPNYIPFSETVTDLKPDIYAGQYTAFLDIL
ncbi:C2 calcium-dependent domain-containing protein 6-like [Dendronephthya gigantea]|uniref:C2 calcium-dependent domain-containing protein 6-like n=1 Tax=Dendronephthya gigantea TaxID=151771 RepID=UPI00106CB1B1|nr:C2 calcium-dependent domain-containing protein 6-like [Dendronephthya gigantea]